MSCKCQPDERYLPENPESSVVYFIPCRICGHHLYVRKRGDYGRIKSAQVLPEGSGLNLKFNPRETDLAAYQKISHAIDLKRPKMSKDEMMEVLYEMLADDEIDIDQFNDYSFKLVSE